MFSMTRLRDLIVDAFWAAVRVAIELGLWVGLWVGGAVAVVVTNKTLRVTIALGLAVTVAVTYGIWFDWEWKAMIGWKALVDYINPDPNDTTGKKDAVQVYAVIVAGVIASITAAVGLANLRLTRKNLEQQLVVEGHRAEQQRELAQGTALQAYYEQIGKLITDKDSNLRNTQREEIRELARGQTLTVLQEVDGNGKVSLLTFLHRAGLIGTENPAVALAGANLRGANLQGADLQGADLQEANLRGVDLYEAKLERANLREANFHGFHGADLRRANLRGADLRGANLRGAVLDYADLQGAQVTDEQLADTWSLQDAVMPDGRKYEDWLKDKEGSGKDVENE
jgi:uncharacterized protein YjbI with pentapeptide repeats